MFSTTNNQDFYNIIDNDSSLSVPDKTTLKHHITSGNYPLALRCACQGGCVALVTAFREKLNGQPLNNINEPSTNGNTALHWAADFFCRSYRFLGFEACWTKTFAIIKNLYFLGCNPKLVNQQNLTFLEIILENLNNEEKKRIFDDYGDFIQERCRISRAQESDKTELWDDYIKSDQFTKFDDSDESETSKSKSEISDQHPTNKSWARQHPYFISTAFVIAGLAVACAVPSVREILSSLWSAIPGIGTLGGLILSRKNESLNTQGALYYRPEPPEIDNGITPITFNIQKHQGIHNTLIRSGMIQFREDVKLTRDKRTWLQEEFISAMELAASDLSPDCLQTVLSILNKKNFYFLFIDDHAYINNMQRSLETTSDLASAYTEVAENRICIDLSGSNILSKIGVTDIVREVLFHELLVHLKAAQEDMQLANLDTFSPTEAYSAYKLIFHSRPGLFIQTANLLLDAVKKDKKMLENKMQLVFRAEEKGMSRLSANERDILLHAIEIVKASYKPTIIGITKVSNSNTAFIAQAKKWKATKHICKYEQPSSTKSSGVKYIFVDSFEVVGDKTWISTVPGPNKTVEQARNIDPGLITLESFLINLKLQLKNAEQQLTIDKEVTSVGTLQAEYVAHLNKLFRGDINLAKVFIPNIVKYLSEHYQTVGCLCEHPEVPTMRLGTH